MVPPRQYSKRANIDCSILVNEIEARPELWDLKNPSRHNRVSLSENWNAIGSALNESAEICRKKWKYLKDQYRKEYRLELRGGPHFKSSWSLYERLSFIKPYFHAILVAHGEQERSQSFGDDFKNGDFNSVSRDCDDEEMENWKWSCRLSNYAQDVVEILDDDDGENDSGVVLSGHGNPPIKKIRLSSVDSRPDPDNDDSLHFFKSLIPFMNKMDAIQQLRVRSTIQNVILHELEAAGNS